MGKSKLGKQAKTKGTTVGKVDKEDLMLKQSIHNTLKKPKKSYTERKKARKVW